MLSPIAHKLISPTQTAFINGRFILDGILVLHELLDDLHARGREVVVLKLDFEKAYDCVRWSFLREIHLARGFVPAYVHRLMQLVCGGHTTICINGVVGPYFKNGRGLRQGDPVSPLLFHFVANALAKITSVATNLCPSGVTHLQYTDDTINLVEKNDLQLANLSKSEAFVF